MARLLSFVTLMLLATTAWALPSVQDVYDAAHQGNYGQAEAMVDAVLKAHPDSAKAHYVHAQILAATHHESRARAELDRAAQLAPGLPFVKPQALADLRARLGETTRAAAPRTAHNTSLLWLLALAIGAVLLLVAIMARRAMQPAPALISGNPGYGPTPYGSPSYGGPFGSAPVVNSGLGSSLVSGLATGVAVGAGVAAGEALVDSFLDNRSGSSAPPVASSSDDFVPPSGASDLGGSDFGIADSSGDNSWDDSAGSGDDVGGDW